MCNNVIYTVFVCMCMHEHIYWANGGTREQWNRLWGCLSVRWGLIYRGFTIPATMGVSLQVLLQPFFDSQPAFTPSKSDPSLQLAEPIQSRGLLGTRAWARCSFISHLPLAGCGGRVSLHSPPFLIFLFLAKPYCWVKSYVVFHSYMI